MSDRITKLENKLNTDSQNFQIECQKEEIKLLNARLEAGCQLPRITPELRKEYHTTFLMNGGGWSQEAVDFACLLNSTLETGNE